MYAVAQLPKNVTSFFNVITLRFEVKGSDSVISCINMNDSRHLAGDSIRGSGTLSQQYLTSAIVHAASLQQPPTLSTSRRRH